MRRGDETREGVLGQMLRRGEITEIVGRLSSGRTSLVTACLRDMTRAGAVTALVDVDHAFDPVLAERVGVDLTRLLWVRCRGSRDAALRATDLLVRCPGFTLIALDLGETVPRVSLSVAFRVKLAVRRSNVALLILGRRRIAGSSAALALQTQRDGLEWGGPGPVPTRLARVRTRVHLLRAHGAHFLSGTRQPGFHGGWPEIEAPDVGSFEWSA